MTIDISLLARVYFATAKLDSHEFRIVVRFVSREYFVRYLYFQYIINALDDQYIES